MVPLRLRPRRGEPARAASRPRTRRRGERLGHPDLVWHDQTDALVPPRRGRGRRLAVKTTIRRARSDHARLSGLAQELPARGAGLSSRCLHGASCRRARAASSPKRLVLFSAATAPSRAWRPTGTEASFTLGTILSARGLKEQAIDSSRRGQRGPQCQRALAQAGMSPCGPRRCARATSSQRRRKDCGWGGGISIDRHIASKSARPPRLLAGAGCGAGADPHPHDRDGASSGAAGGDPQVVRWHFAIYAGPEATAAARGAQSL